MAEKTGSEVSSKSTALPGKSTRSCPTIQGPPKTEKSEDHFSRTRSNSFFEAKLFGSHWRPGPPPENTKNNLFGTDRTLKHQDVFGHPFVSNYKTAKRTLSQIQNNRANVKVIGKQRYENTFNHIYSEPQPERPLYSNLQIKIPIMMDTKKKTLPSPPLTDNPITGATPAEKANPSPTVVPEAAADVATPKKDCDWSHINRDDIEQIHRRRHYPEKSKYRPDVLYVPDKANYFEKPKVKKVESWQNMSPAGVIRTPTSPTTTGRRLFTEQKNVSQWTHKNPYNSDKTVEVVKVQRKDPAVFTQSAGVLRSRSLCGSRRFPDNVVTNFGTHWTYKDSRCDETADKMIVREDPAAKVLPVGLQCFGAKKKCTGVRRCSSKINAIHTGTWTHKDPFNSQPDAPTPTTDKSKMDPAGVENPATKRKVTGVRRCESKEKRMLVGSWTHKDPFNSKPDASPPTTDKSQMEPAGVLTVFKPNA